MIVWWGMFLKGNGAQFRVTLAGMPKKCYPTSVEGLIRIGLDPEVGRRLSEWIDAVGVKERIAVPLFIYCYAAHERLESYTGKEALERYLARLQLDEGFITARINLSKYIHI